jgi:hypothetical protein
MAAPLRPNSAPTYGKKNWIFVATIASPALIPVATTEVNAAGSLDFTNMVFQNNTDRPAQSTNRVTAERRVGDTTIYEQVGTTSFTGGNLTYSFDAQAATGSTGKKAFEKFVAGTSGFLVERLGKLNSTTPAAGDFVNVYPITFGPSQPTEQGDAESAEAAAQCAYAVTGQPVFSVALT